MKHCLYILCLTVLLSLAACIKDEYQGPEPYPSTRTVLVYLAGDHDLGADIGLTPQLLRQDWTYTGNRCLIYYDAPDAAPVLLSLRGGCQTYPTPFIETVAEYPEENSASAVVFGRVLHDVVQMYPADDYGLVFTSHGSGWLPAGTLAAPQTASAGCSLRSIGNDRNPGTMTGTGVEMELADFAAAIPDRQFAFIVFEACLMSGVEVAYELRDKTDYILASSAEMLAPGYGVVYASASHYLFDTRLTVVQSLCGFAESYYDYMNAQGGAGRSATQSLIRTDEMEKLADLTGEVLGGATSSTDNSDIENLQHFDRPGSYGDMPAIPRYFDFAAYMECFASPEQYAEIVAQLARTVIWKAATPEFLSGQNGFRIDRHCGLTTYIPQGIFPALDAAYERTSWYKATR